MWLATQKYKPQFSLKSMEKKAVIVTKTRSANKASFPKKVKAMNSLLAKATLLSQ
jgi:hypothetical protein